MCKAMEDMRNKAAEEAVENDRLENAKKMLADGLAFEKVAEYSKADIDKMSAEEFEKHINEDIYEDAYAYNETAKIAYKGKNLAEGLESQLFMCPSCKKLSSLKTNKNTIVKNFLIINLLPYRKQK